MKRHLALLLVLVMELDFQLHLLLKLIQFYQQFHYLNLEFLIHIFSQFFLLFQMSVYHYQLFV